MTRRRQARMSAFTLMDLIIALAIVALLAALAYPGYQDVLRRQRRLDAIHALLQVQGAQLRYRGSHGRYAKRLTALGWPGDPAPSPAGYYLLHLEVADDAGYVVLATPRPGGVQDGDACRRIALDQDGPAPARSSEPGCWRR